MKVGNWEIEGTISTIYFALIIFIILSSMIATIWVAIIGFKEIKRPAIDLFKIIQSILIMVFFWSSIFVHYWYVWLNCRTLLYQTLFIILFSTLYLYYVVNLLCWYILVFHINTLRNMRNGVDYEEWKTRIKAVELKSLIAIITFEIIYLFINILLSVFSTKFVELAKEISRIVSIEFSIIYTALTIAQFLMYK